VPVRVGGRACRTRFGEGGGEKKVGEEVGEELAEEVGEEAGEVG